MGFDGLKAKKQLQGDSLLFIIKFTEIPGTYMINHGRMKD